jgi:hypothetical protein
MKTRHAGAAVLALAGGYTAVLVGARRWHQHWGATAEEIARPLPGDDLIPSSRLDSTHAITIKAPAERIWPWLAQMGYGDRAGTYSYDLFERSVGRNLSRIDPEIPSLIAGGTMPFYPGAPMTVSVADPPHAKWAPFMWLLVEPAHFVMGRRQLIGLRERAEATRVEPIGHI